VEYAKVKSVAKQVLPKGEKLTRLILNTTKTIADVVGATLGPGGAPIIIERAEHDLPPMVTKDGVTVFKSLGFTDAAAHVLMESMRDAASRTAVDAGDGTTTATILAEAIIRYALEFTKRHPTARPQKIVRTLYRAMRDVVTPTIEAASIKVEADDAGRQLLHSVAKLSANGDDELADAVLQCFDLVGDEGNVTIVEASGPSKYEVEEINGYPIPMGYDGSCGKFAPMFINDQARQVCYLENPVFVLYHGHMNDPIAVYGLLEKVVVAIKEHGYKSHNVIVVASSFGEQVLATFGAGMQHATALKMYPLAVPKSPLPNYGSQFLEDLSAITGATVFDPVVHTLEQGDVPDLGPGVAAFEAGRSRSTIIGRAAEAGEPWATMELDQISVVEAQLAQPEGGLDKLLLQERLAKLTGGIAKLRVIGSSNGELKERRDRAEDAVCAVRGAIKHGCLPGGGWTLLKVARELALAYPSDIVINEVLKPALLEPVFRLLTNCGMTSEEAMTALDPILTALKADQVLVYDAWEGRYGDPIEMGILDSTPAVMEAMRNSLSIASQLGTLGGIVVHPRDAAFERQEARDVQDWIRNANVNEADERP
jgi:chaperonin GroEL